MHVVMSHSTSPCTFRVRGFGVALSHGRDNDILNTDYRLSTDVTVRKLQYRVGTVIRVSTVNPA